jgi:hypothetical protein
MSSGLSQSFIVVDFAKWQLRASKQPSGDTTTFSSTVIGMYFGQQEAGMAIAYQLKKVTE